MSFEQYVKLLIEHLFVKSTKHETKEVNKNIVTTLFGIIPFLILFTTRKIKNNWTISD